MGIPLWNPSWKWIPTTTSPPFMLAPFCCRIQFPKIHAHMKRWRPSFLILKQQHRFLIKDHGQCLGAMASNIYSRPKCFVKMMTSKIFFCCLHLATGKWIWQRVLISLKFNWYTSSTIHPINHVCMYTLKRYIFMFPNTLLNIIKFKKFAFTSF